jgi:murein DD-endopeptidase / murein LD-carboxypeptidase
MIRIFLFCACLLLHCSADLEAQVLNDKPVKFEDKLLSFYNHHKVTIDTTINPDLYLISYNWLGTHYKYSGNSSKGIDCSGFTKIIYRDVFKDTLSGGSADIAKRVNLISRENLKIGDMVFFKIKRKRVSHVGVYLGNNKFVHSAIKGGVQINDLDEAYYKRYFYSGGRRSEVKTYN